MWAFALCLVAFGQVSTKPAEPKKESAKGAVEQNARLSLPGEVFAFSPDSQTLALGGTDGSVQLWDIATSKLTAKLEGHKGQVRQLAFSSDGKKLVSGATDKTIKVWDVTTRKITANWAEHAGEILRLAISPDGKTLVSADGDKTVKLWDVTSGKTTLSLDGHAEPSSYLTFSPNGQTLVVGGPEQMTFVAVGGRKTTAGLEPPSDPEHRPGHVGNVVFSPDGKTLAIGGGGIFGKLWLYDLATRKQIGFFEYGQVVTSVAFSPDSKNLAIGCAQFGPYLHELSSGKTIRSFEFPAGGAPSVAISPDGKVFAGGGIVEVHGKPRDGEVRLWDIATGKPVAIFKMVAGDAERNWVYGLQFSPDGKVMATITEDHILRVWDVPARRPLE